MESTRAVYYFVFLAIVCLWSNRVICRDIFTAYNHMAKLATVELELHRALQEYISAEETKLLELREFSKFISTARQINDDSTTALTDYAANPIRGYLLLKRFVWQWRQIKEIMDGEKELILGRLRNYQELIPSEVDLDGALNAIARIQETYHLPPSYLAAGLREDPTDESQLSVEDTYTIGRNSYREEKYYNTKIWMEEAYRQMNGSIFKDGVNMGDILDHLSWVEYKLGNLEKAVNYTVEWLRIETTNEDSREIISLIRFGQKSFIRKRRNLSLFLTKDLGPKLPDHARARANLVHLRKENERRMEDSSGEVQKPDAKSEKLKPHERKRYQYKNFDWPTERENYKRLCRNDEMLTYEEKQDDNKLKCSYFNKDPLLRIKPAKMERVWEKPPIYIFREFASKKEIEDLKAISGPQLSRATVHNPTTGKIEFANYRISEFSWLYDHDGESVAKINARLGAVTQLDTATAEGLQVQNYGMAGQYDPHYDFSRLKLDKARAAKEHELKLIKSFGDGNRIATALLYMNQVEAGGATVFPYVGARLTPSEGDLVFWHNLMKSGEGDFRTRHAGCPIISGTKWVANKWFHEVGQEFKRPCGLSPDE